jgi:hypothetical protein
VSLSLDLQAIFPINCISVCVRHDIYKWQSDQRRQSMRVRSASFAAPPAPPDPAFEHIHEPGGFRRNYVLLRANEQGAEEPRTLNNFIDFLFIFGHFVGLPFVSVFILLKTALRRARTLRKTTTTTR